MITEKTKIMHGMREVAGQAGYSVKGLRHGGYDATTVFWDVPPMQYSYDKCLNIVQSKKYLYPWYMIKILTNAVYCAFKYDVFHFHFGHSLIPKNYDLWLLKLLKKKFFFEFHGSDLRQGNISIEENPFFKDVDFSNDEKLRKRAEKLQKKANGIILHDDELVSHLPLGSDKVYIVPLRVDLSRFEAFYPQKGKKRITIVHAPSQRAVKGTKFVLEAIDNLKGKYNIELRLVENMNQDQAFQEYKRADLIIDQLIVGTYGVFSIEAMAMGKPVITYITDAMAECLPEELPIINANCHNIESVVEKYIVNENERIERGKAGRQYVEKYHNCNKNAQVLAEIYSGSQESRFGRDAFLEVKRK